MRVSRLQPDLDRPDDKDPNTLTGQIQHYPSGYQHRCGLHLPCAATDIYTIVVP